MRSWMELICILAPFSSAIKVQLTQLQLHHHGREASSRQPGTNSGHLAKNSKQPASNCRQQSTQHRKMARKLHANSTPGIRGNPVSSQFSEWGAPIGQPSGQPLARPSVSSYMKPRLHIAGSLVWRATHQQTSWMSGMCRMTKMCRTEMCRTKEEKNQWLRKLSRGSSKCWGRSRRKRWGQVAGGENPDLHAAIQPPTPNPGLAGPADPAPGVVSPHQNNMCYKLWMS